MVLKSLVAAAALLALVGCAEEEPPNYVSSLSQGTLNLADDDVTWEGSERWNINTSRVSCIAAWDVTAESIDALADEELRIEIVSVAPSNSCATNAPAVRRMETGEVLSFVSNGLDAVVAVLSDADGASSYQYASAELFDDQIVYRRIDDEQSLDVRDLREPPITH